MFKHFCVLALLGLIVTGKATAQDRYWVGPAGTASWNSASNWSFAFGGPGGKVTVMSDAFLASQDSSVTASSALSTPGTVNIQAAITNVSGLLQPLPENIFQATSLLQQSCAARYSGGKLSSLVVGSLVGLPWEPGSFIPSPLYRLAEKSNPSITQAGPSAESFQLTLASANPKFSHNWPCTK